MATGVKPRDDERRLSRSDLETIQDAMKSKKFRDMFAEYCDEIRDPANQELYQNEMTQLEKERGYDVTFINPKGGYVIKTSVAGDRKAFINICSNDKVEKPTYKVEVVDGRRGMNWQIPYSIIPPREDFDQNRQRCVIYDVVFHPDTLRMAEVNKQFRELVNKTAFDGLKQTYNIHLDNNNIRFPKSQYKGMSTPAVIRKEDPNYQPPDEEEVEHLSPEMIDKLYPQRNYDEHKTEPVKKLPKETSKVKSKTPQPDSEFIHTTQDGYTIPKYVIKQQKNVDLQDYTYHKDSKQYSAIPSHIVVEINLPLLSSTKCCTLDVQDRSLRLASEKPAKYKLEIDLPYSVNDECGTATFDKTKHKLIVKLPVVKRNYNPDNNSLKVDSGLESEENSGSQSDEDNNNRSNLVVELSSTNQPELMKQATDNSQIKDTFLEPSLSYMLPAYTFNVMDDIVALTFHVKNTDPDSVYVKNNHNEISVKFTSIGSGFVPVHYAAIIIFDENMKFNNVSGEAWDNNVILQLELSEDVPQKFQIGLNKESMVSEYFDVTQVKKVRILDEIPEDKAVDPKPLVEVTNLGSETNIVVSSNHSDYDEDDFDSPTTEEREIVFTDLGNSASGAKSILRKPMRSYSESSTGDIASSMDYISSDCIPEESSLKKTVRFNHVIAKQFYRYNSSIEGQKKKNQRKKSKKRNLERRKSESEAEDEVINSQPSKPRLKSALKQRRDSGLADTSDAENECKDTPNGSLTSNNTDGAAKSVLNIVNNNETANQKTEPDIWETKPTKAVKPTCDTLKHNTDLYDPDKLNKGQYLEVEFKNDLIFDLDM